MLPPRSHTQNLWPKNVPFSLGSDTYHPHLHAHPKHVAQNVPFFSGLVQLTPPPTTWRTGPFPPKNVAQGQSCTLYGLTRRVRSHQTRILVKFHILYGHLKKVLELQSAVFQIIWNYIRFTILRKVSHIWSCLWSHFKRKGLGWGREGWGGRGGRGGDMQCKIFSLCPLWNITTHLHMWHMLRFHQPFLVWLRPRNELNLSLKCQTCQNFRLEGDYLLTEKVERKTAKWPTAVNIDAKRLILIIHCLNCLKWKTAKCSTAVNIDAQLVTGRPRG